MADGVGILNKGGSANEKEEKFYCTYCYCIIVYIGSPSVGGKRNNETEQNTGFHVCYRKYYAQSSRQQRKNKVSIMEIQQYTDRNWYQKVLRSYGASYRVRNNWDGKLTTVYRRNFSRYRLIDINNDGIKELMLHNYPWAVFFTYYKGKVTPLIYGSTRGAYLKGQYLTIKTGTSSENICRTYILQNGKVKQIINYFHTTSSAYPVPIYEVNGKRYSKTAFFKVYNKYMNNAKLLF